MLCTRNSSDMSLFTVVDRFTLEKLREEIEEEEELLSVVVPVPVLLLVVVVSLEVVVVVVRSGWKIRGLFSIPCVCNGD